MTNVMKAVNVMNVLVAGAIALFLVVAVQAQSGLTGKWEGATPAGSPLVLDLTVKDTMLTGSFIREGQSSPIKDGKVSKDTFSFKVTVNGTDEGFAGKFAGDEVTVWIERHGPERAVTLKRGKK